MAIELISTTKIQGDIYVVTVRDTGDQIGTDEKGVAIYRTHSVRHNIGGSADSLKTRIEEKLLAAQKEESDAATVDNNIRVTVESIDTTKLEAK